MRSDFVFQATIRHAKIFPPTPIWNIFPYHILPPLVRASIYNPERLALSTNSASLETSSLSLQIRLSRPNCERNNITIRVLGAILILLRLFVRNFIFGAEANISARAAVRHVIATKFQPGWPGWNFSPGWNSPCNQALRATTVTALSERNVETRQIKAVTGHRSDTSIKSYCERPTLR